MAEEEPRWVLAFVALVACGGRDTPARPSGGTETITTTSIETFRRAWSELLPHVDPQRAAALAPIDALVRDPRGPLEVRSEPCRTRRAFIQSHVPEIEKLTLGGSLGAVERDGSCRIVFVAGGEKREVEAVLTADGRQVLFIWRVPEG